MFAFFFDEDHPDLKGLTGPECATIIVSALEKITPIPATRILDGGLLHNLLVYKVKSVSLGPTAENKPEPIIGTAERSQHSIPDRNKRLSLICDLAETLSNGVSSFTEGDVLLHLARKNIWTIVAPQLSERDARQVHSEAIAFKPYLGFSSLDGGNPLHRRLFLERLFDTKFINPTGLHFKRDDEDENVFAGKYGSSKHPIFLDREDFEKSAPILSIPTSNSARGELTALRIEGNDSGHRSKVAQELMKLDKSEIAAPVDFSAELPIDRIEFAVDPRKFTEYLLNLNHKDGKSKARFFIEALDIQPRDWRFLADQLIQAAKLAGLYRIKLSKYGASHGSLALVTGRNGKTAVVETGWILPDKGPAQFVTAYPDDDRRTEGLTQVTGRVPPPSLPLEAQWSTIHAFAHEAGMKAGNITVPTPMVLERYGTEWGGECGFSWIELRDGRKSFSKWIVKNAGGYRAYPGVRLYSKMNTQSMAKNEAYCYAYAEVLRANGIDCIVGSRLD